MIIIAARIAAAPLNCWPMMYRLLGGGGADKARGSSARHWRTRSGSRQQTCFDPRFRTSGTHFAAPVLGWPANALLHATADFRPAVLAAARRRACTDARTLMEAHPHLGILHVVNSLDYGGLERVVCDLALQQQADGHRVRVFSICDTGGFRETLENAGVPVTVGGKRRTLDLRVLRALRQAATGHGIDILHTHNFVPNYYAATAMLGTRHRHAIVNSCHNMG